MDFGMPVLLEAKSPEASAALCRELGLDFLELNVNLPEYAAGLNVHTFRQLAEKYGIYYTLHLDENLTPCDFNDWVAEAYAQTAEAYIGVARALSVPVITMHLHPGVHFTLPQKRVYLYDEYEDVALGKMAQFRDRCTAAVSTSGIKICVENYGGYTRAPFLLKSLDLLLQSPAFGLCFDVGHNAIDGFTDEPLILARKEKLRHMHLHDAREKADHLSPGDGTLPMQEYLALAEQTGCRVVLEVKTKAALERAVAWVRALSG